MLPVVAPGGRLLTGSEPVVRTRPKDRKQQILLVARDLFVDLGYHQVTMRLIADKLGIRAGALYRHYANKAELFDAVVRESFAELTPPSERDGSLTQVLAESAAAVVPRSYLGALWSREARALPPETYSMVRDVLRRFARAYIRLMQSERPELSPVQAELLAWALQSILASPSRYPVRLPAADLTEVILGASLAVCATVLIETSELVQPVDQRLQPASRRERLLLGAMRLFAENGYQETGMNDIGAVAGVTGPSLYAHFESKAALLEAVVDRGTHLLWGDLDRALQAHAAPLAALGDVVAGYVGFAHGWSGIQLPSGEPSVDEVTRGRQREYVAEWVTLAQEARPGVDLGIARSLVHTALAVIDDLCRTPHLINASFDANVTAIAMAILRSEPAG